MDLTELTIEEIESQFEMVEDWEQRYLFLIELGDSLPPFPDEWRIPAYKVEGCISQVWLVPRLVTHDPVVLDFSLDSDARIVKGLVALVKIIYGNKTPEQILKADIESIFNRLGLEKHLSPNRRNGFFSMVERIQKIAKNPLPISNHLA